MAYIHDLIATRDRYAALLAEQPSPPADTSWNEYEEFLLSQIRQLDELIGKAQSAAVDREITSCGFTL